MNATVGRLSIWGMVLRSLSFYRALQLTVMLSVAIATAVIVGALLVGDSVRGSLRFQAIDRLGDIDFVLTAPRYLDASIASRIAEGSGVEGIQAYGTILFPRVTAESGNESNRNRAGSILLVGADEPFWKLSHSPAPPTLKMGEIILNEPLATELSVKVGDEITLRLPEEQSVSADSPLGKHNGLTISLPRLKLVAVIPAKGLGRFDLRNNQRLPRNAYVSNEQLQFALSKPGKINAVLGALPDRTPSAVARDVAALNEKFVPTLSDLGLKLVRRSSPPVSGSGAADESSALVYDYYSLESEQMVLGPAAEKAVLKALPEESRQPVITYLANAIEKLPRDDGSKSNSSDSQEQAEPANDRIEVPYSTITGIDNSKQFPMIDAAKLSPDTKWGERQVIVNQWLAERLKIVPGDRLRIFYYLPETVHGKEVEQQFDVDVLGIAPLTRPKTPYRRNRDAIYSESPTLANDPYLTPEVPGVTDQDSINDWDLPFPLTRKIDAEDDRYWNDFRLTPKLFMRADDAEELFGSRFGTATSIRIDPKLFKDQAEVESKLVQGIQTLKGEFGLRFIPIKLQSLQAASGTTPFDGLFLGLSMFVIVAALMLVALLFRLGLERRADQMGLLLALGWSVKRLRRFLLTEGIVVAIVGATLGIPIGLAYAAAMLWGLRTWWVGAVSVPFLEFYATPLSVFIGWLIGIVVCFVVIFWSSRRLNRLPARQLLTGRTEEIGTGKSAGPKWLSPLAIVIALLGATVAVAGFSQSGQAQAGMFVGGGMLLLSGGILYAYHRLLQWQAGVGGKQRNATVSSYGIGKLAQSNVARNPLRSVLALGLLSLTSFLILTLSVFQTQPTEQAIGGFDWVGESSQPIHQDIGDSSIRTETLGESAPKLSKAAIFAFRLRPGDEASCNNLYQSTEPKVIGVPDRFSEFDRGPDNPLHFPWFATEKIESGQSPWSLLSTKGTGTAEDPIPVVLDQNTAMWSLHLSGTVGEQFSFEFSGERVFFKTVGLLSNSLLQGALLIGEANFLKTFPDQSGYQYFLARSGGEDPELVSQTLESGWSDEGLDFVRSEKVLSQLLAVQNTYLKAFQMLGTLGLLLGTIGLAAVQVRSVLERRGEFALLRAIGFAPGRVAQLVLLESVVLLVGGISLGAIVGFVCVAPVIAQNSTPIDWLPPLLWLVGVTCVGLIASSIAVRIAARLPLLSSLRKG